MNTREIRSEDLQYSVYPTGVSKKVFLNGIPVPELPPPIIPITQPNLLEYYQPGKYVLPRVRVDLTNFVVNALGLSDEVKLAVVGAPDNIDADLAIACFPPTT